MYNFPFTWTVDGVEKHLWYSRPTAVGLFGFAKNENGDWFVLAAKRGKGMPVESGKWNCPGGFVDFNESLWKAASRECMEETGITVCASDIYFLDVDSVPHAGSDRQTISCRMLTVFNETVEDLILKFSYKYMEKDEVDDIKFIRVSDISHYDWAFNHNNLIAAFFYKYIEPSKMTFLDRLKKAWKYITNDSSLYETKNLVKYRY